MKHSVFFYCTGDFAKKFKTLNNFDGLCKIEGCIVNGRCVNGRPGHGEVGGLAVGADVLGAVEARHLVVQRPTELDGRRTALEGGYEGTYSEGRGANKENAAGE